MNIYRVVKYKHPTYTGALNNVSINGSPFVDGPPEETVSYFQSKESAEAHLNKLREAMNLLSINEYYFVIIQTEVAP